MESPGEVWQINKEWHQRRQTDRDVIPSLEKRSFSYRSAGGGFNLFLAITETKTRSREHHFSVFKLNRISNMHTPNSNIQKAKICHNFKLGRRCKKERKRTNECLQLIPLRFLETILSHVEILFGAICHGKRDRIHYLLHSIIAGPGVLLRWERSQKSPWWGGGTFGHLLQTRGLGWGLFLKGKMSGKKCPTFYELYTIYMSRKQLTFK